MHGGTTCDDVKEKVVQAEKMAQTNQEVNIDTVLFFDEANTTEALGMIKEVMVDHRINGRPIGTGLHRLQFIAACNPYRRSVAGGCTVSCICGVSVVFLYHSMLELRYIVRYIGTTLSRII